MDSNSSKSEAKGLPAEPEILTSYLDGEADERDSEAVEVEIARNPKVRQEIDSLQRAWDLLEYLDRPGTKGDFTSRTLELATRSLVETPAEPPPRAPWPGRRLWWTSLALLAVTGGLWAWSRPLLDPRIEQESPLLRKLDVYRAVGNVEFIERLDRENLLDQMDQLLEPES
jgi:anti-sigma factor RsiW